MPSTAPGSQREAGQSRTMITSTRSHITALQKKKGLPSASSLYSFTKPPSADWNKTPCFSNATRTNHSSSSSFLGTTPMMFHERGIEYPGPCSYSGVTAASVHSATVAASRASPLLAFAASDLLPPHSLSPPLPIQTRHPPPRRLT